jgi:hypothetical protein
MATASGDLVDKPSGELAKLTPRRVSLERDWKE